MSLFCLEYYKLISKTNQEGPDRNETSNVCPTVDEIIRDFEDVDEGTASLPSQSKTTPL